MGESIMQFHWTECMSGDLEEAIQLLGEFWIPIVIIRRSERWQVWSGDQTMITCHTHEEAKAFVLGMAISYITLPEKIQEDLKAFSP